MKTEQNLNVLFLPAWYPNKYDKTAGIFVSEHAKAVSKNLNVSVLAIIPGSFADIFKVFVSNEDGIKVYRSYYVKFPKIFLPITIMGYVLASLIALFKFLKVEGKPTYSHIHVLTRAGMTALLLKYCIKVPYVITEHWTRYLPVKNTYKGFVRKWFTKFIVKRSNGISAVSIDLKSAMIKHGLNHQNFHIVPNVVNCEQFVYEKRFPLNKFIFLHVSTLVDTVKNTTGILRAFEMFKKYNEDFELHMIGHHPDIKQYENSLSMGLKSHVFFHGEKLGEELVDFYRRADAFVMFSNFENQPCVLLESLCMGLPVISSKVGGIGEIVDARNGILVEAKNEKQLTKALREMTNAYDKYDREKISLDACAQFGMESVNAKFYEFYKKAFAIP